MPLIDRHTNGVYIIAATPFAEDGALDTASIQRLTDFYLSKGVNGMTVLGVMGEAPKLTPEESRLAAKTFLEAAQVPVIVGVSGAGIGTMTEFTKYVMDNGAAGVMVAPPSSLKHEVAVKSYYAAVCAAFGPDVPIVFQDYPQLTGVNVSTSTILELTTDHPQIVMLKHEDCPGLPKLSAVRAGSDTVEIPRISILCGNGGLYLPQEMQRGADGAMTGFAFPELLVGVVSQSLAGNHDAAEDLFDAYLPVIKHEQQPGIGLALRKRTLLKRGAIASDHIRAPGPKLSPADVAELETLLARLDRRLGALGMAAE
ncbi:MAG: dihydrodipicolinate synthase family protein [Pseudomonadota bacterium]